MRRESFSLTLSMLSSHSVRYTTPVSSPISASHTLCADPSLPIGMSRVSVLDTTLALTLTAFDCGVKSPTLASTGCFLFSKNPSTANLVLHTWFYSLRQMLDFLYS